MKPNQQFIQLKTDYYTVREKTFKQRGKHFNALLTHPLDAHIIKYLDLINSTKDMTTYASCSGFSSDHRQAWRRRSWYAKKYPERYDKKQSFPWVTIVFRTSKSRDDAINLLLTLKKASKKLKFNPVSYPDNCHGLFVRLTSGSTYEKVRFWKDVVSTLANDADPSSSDWC